MATPFGLRRSALIEVGAYLAVALLIDLALFDGTRFRSTSPHPFWPLVLLVAVQYGTSDALLAAAAASVALWAGNVPEQTIAQDRYDYLLMIAREPVMWFTAAIALGELRMRHVRERQVLQQELSVAVQRAEDVSAACSRVTAVKNNLETRIAGQLRGAMTMYQAARSLEQMDPIEVLLSVTDVVRIIMNPEKFSLYLLRDDVLEVCTGEGWTAEDAYNRVFRADTQLFHEVIARQRIVCGANEEDERMLSGEGILAGPLKDRESGQVIGMLKIERIGFFDLHFSNVQTFRALCDWIADAYVNARRFQAAESDAFVEPATGLLSYAVFERQSAYLQALAHGMGFSLSTLLLALENPDDFPADRRTQIRPSAAAVVKGTLRKTDQAFDGRQSGYLCCVLMPDTSRFEAERIGERLLRDLSLAAPEARFSYVVQTVDSSAPAPVECHATA